jgi:hypothetical protein
VLITRSPAAPAPVAGGKAGDGGFATVQLFDAVAPRLVGFGEPSRFSF